MWNMNYKIDRFKHHIRCDVDIEPSLYNFFLLLLQEQFKDIKNDAWVTLNNDFWVTSEAICQWFSRVTK